MADAPAPFDDPLTKLMLDAQAPEPAAPPPDAAPAGPAPAPVGPPRLRGQGPAAPPPQPGAPPEDLSVPTVLAGAQKNFARSAMGNIASTAEFLNPFNYLRDAAGLGAIAQGALSKAGIIDQGDPKAQAAHQAPINAIENMNWEHYGNLNNFLRTVRDDPTTPLADAAAIASLALGGEGMVARVPGVAGDILRAGMTGAKIAQYGDPTYAALRAAGAGAKMAGAAGRLASKVPGAGLVGEAVGASGGAVLGHALSHVIPIPGASVVGGVIGDRLAKGAMRVLSNPAGPVRRAIGKTIAAGVSEVPRVGPLARSLPASPEEQQAAGAVQGAFGGPGGAPGATPAGGPPPPMDPDEAQAEAMERGFGLRGWDAAPAAPPSAGLQGAAPSGDPGNVPDVIRQAEGGANQPVGFRPGGGGSARGAFQMTDGTYATNLRKYHPEIAARMNNDQIKAYRNTPAGWSLNEPMGRQMVQDEIAQLQHEGIAPTADNVGTLHMLGNTRLLHADPSTPIEQVTGGDQRSANAGIFRNIRTAGDYLNWMRRRNAMAMAQLQPRSAYAADGGRIERQVGGQVIDLTEKLLQRAERAQKAAQSATKPLLGLSDDTVAQALRVAQRGL